MIEAKAKRLPLVRDACLRRARTFAMHDGHGGERTVRTILIQGVRLPRRRPGTWGSASACRAPLAMHLRRGRLRRSSGAGTGSRCQAPSFRHSRRLFRGPGAGRDDPFVRQRLEKARSPSTCRVDRPLARPTSKASAERTSATAVIGRAIPPRPFVPAIRSSSPSTTDDRLIVYPFDMEGDRIGRGLPGGDVAAGEHHQKGVRIATPSRSNRRRRVKFKLNSGRKA